MSWRCTPAPGELGDMALPTHGAAALGVFCGGAWQYKKTLRPCQYEQHLGQCVSSYGSVCVSDVCSHSNGGLAVILANAAKGLATWLLLDFVV